jgi:hypothetical protein
VLASRIFATSAHPPVEQKGTFLQRLDAALATVQLFSNLIAPRDAEDLSFSGRMFLFERYWYAHYASRVRHFNHILKQACDYIDSGN